MLLLREKWFHYLNFDVCLFVYGPVRTRAYEYIWDFHFEFDLLWAFITKSGWLESVASWIKSGDLISKQSDDWRLHSGLVCPSVPCQIPLFLNIISSSYLIVELLRLRSRILLLFNNSVNLLTCPTLRSISLLLFFIGKDIVVLSTWFLWRFVCFFLCYEQK